MTFDPVRYSGTPAPGSKAPQFFTLRNNKGLELTFMDQGATWLSCTVPLTTGERREVLVGPATYEDHLNSGTYCGATVGRYANRIAGAQFESQGETFPLSANDGANILHGGREGFDRRRWNVEARGRDTLVFKLTSPDGQQGFPGTLDVTATWTLRHDGSIVSTLEAKTDRRTPVNLTNHAYFNLAATPTILDHSLQISADHWLPVDEACIPRGPLEPVGGTVFDFRKPRSFRDDQAAPLIYDHSFLLRGDKHKAMREAARLTSPGGDLTLVMETDKPALQLYNGQALGGMAKPDGTRHSPFAALALETHFLPDSPNRPDWPHESCFLGPGETYAYKTIYRFED